MAYETEGLPGIYRIKRKQEAIESAPIGIEMNSQKIKELERRIVALEKKMNGSS